MFPSLNPGHIGLRLDLDAGLDAAARLGFGGYDASLEALHAAVQASGAAAVRDAFASRGLRIGAWNLPFPPYRESEASLLPRLDALAPLLPAAATLGAHRACMWILPGHESLPYEANLELHVARFTSVAALLADHGIRLGLEFIGPLTLQRRFAHPFLRTLGEMLDLAGRIGHGTGILLDCWHWHASGGTLDDLADLSDDQLVHVHVNDAPPGLALDELIDNQRRLPTTTGVIDLAGFMRALAAAGYDGPVTAEPFDQALNALPAEEKLAATARTTRAAVALAREPEGAAA